MNRKMPSLLDRQHHAIARGRRMFVRNRLDHAIGDARAIDFLSAREIGDADGDGAWKFGTRGAIRSNSCGGRRGSHKRTTRSRCRRRTARSHPIRSTR